MNDQHDKYKELAGWDTYVKVLRKKLKKQKWDRLIQQVADRAGQSFRPRGPGFSVLDRPNRLIVQRETPAEHSLRQVAYFRGLVYHWYVKQDAREEPDSLNPQEYKAQRLNQISRVLGTYKQFGSTIGGETKWVLGRDLEAVLSKGDRSPATVGKVLGLVDWFQHCLAAFKGRTVSPAVKPVKITALSPLEQVLGEGFTVKQLDALAHAVGLVNDAGRYCASDKGAFAGFCRALQDKKVGKLKGALETVVSIVASHFGVVTKVRKTDTDIARHFYTLTNRALKNAAPTD